MHLNFVLCLYLPDYVQVDADAAGRVPTYIHGALAFVIVFVRCCAVAAGWSGGCRAEPFWFCSELLLGRALGGCGVAQMQTNLPFLCNLEKF